MEYEIEDITNYPELEDQIREKLSQSDKNRFVPMEERQDTSVLSVDVLRNICHGKICVIVNCRGLQITAGRRNDPHIGPQMIATKTKEWHGFILAERENINKNRSAMRIFEGFY